MYRTTGRNAVITKFWSGIWLNNRPTKTTLYYEKKTLLALLFNRYILVGSVLIISLVFCLVLCCVCAFVIVLFVCVLLPVFLEWSFLTTPLVFSTAYCKLNFLNFQLWILIVMYMCAREYRFCLLLPFYHYMLELPRRSGIFILFLFHRNVYNLNCSMFPLKYTFRKNVSFYRIF